MDRPKPNASALKNLRNIKNSTGGGNLFIKNSEIKKVYIRVLPATHSEDVLAMGVGQHWLPVLNEKGNKTVVTCPDFTYGQPCPICDVARDLGGIEPLREYARELRAQKQFWFKVLLRVEGEEYNPENVKIFRAPKVVFDTIFQEMEEEQFDLTDVKQGADIRVTASGEGKNSREYKCSIRERSPLAKTNAQRKAILEKAASIDFTRFVAEPTGLEELAQQVLEQVDVDLLEESDLARLDSLREDAGLSPLGDETEVGEVEEKPRRKKKRKTSTSADKPRRKKKRSSTTDADEERPRRRKKKRRSTSV